MYAFRKPITAATFDGLLLWGINYKVVIVITQVMGYLTAKFLGIKVIAELSHQNRGKLLLGFIGMAWLSLWLFGLIPPPYNFPCMFINGLALGFVWGVVFSYIEGRNTTDILATFLTISFIFSSGVIKSIGLWLTTKWGISDFWMPFWVGALFALPICGSIMMLEKIPPPTADDIAQRVERVQLNADERKKLLRSFSTGLFAMILLNVLLTIGRDIKDNFLLEIWASFGLETPTYIFAKMESWVSLIILCLLACVVLVKNHKNAFLFLHIIIAFGLIITIVFTYLYTMGHINTFVWMIMHGVGLYLSYITFQSLYFERFIAAFRLHANVGFLMYTADFLGYLGSCMVLLAKEIGILAVTWDSFFIGLTYGVTFLGLIGTASAYVYFQQKIKSVYHAHTHI
jgi:MFS family permease